MQTTTLQKTNVQLTPKQVFDTLVEQNTIVSKLSYEELETTSANILVKCYIKGYQFYVADLWQSLFRVKPHYVDPDQRPSWVEPTLLNAARGYTSQLNDAAIYQTFYMFLNHYLIPEYEPLVEHLLYSSPEYNLQEFGSENPLEDTSQIEIVLISDYQLKQELKKYEDQDYQNLIDYYIKTYNKHQNKITKFRKKAIDRLLFVENKFAVNENYKVLNEDPRIHQGIHDLIELIKDDFDSELEAIEKIDFPTKDQYSTSHLTKLY